MRDSMVADDFYSRETAETPMSAIAARAINFIIILCKILYKYNINIGKIFKKLT